MVVGHCALALGAKKFAPDVSLGTLLMAALLADLLWPVLVLTGVEMFQIRIDATAVMPLEFMRFQYSHSLVSLIFAGVVFAAGRAIVRTTSGRTLLVLTALVVSHWVLDVISHGPDVPVTPTGDGRLGLGLWNSVPGTLLVEGLLLAGGVALYATTTWSVNRQGRIGLWVLAGVLAAAHVALVFAPVPQSHEGVLGIAGSLWLVVIAGYWVDRHRTVPLRRGSRPAGGAPERTAARPHVRRQRAPARAGHTG
jgi:hypothetical protein